jgi:hypothetical protein
MSQMSGWKTRALTLDINTNQFVTETVPSTFSVLRMENFEGAVFLVGSFSEIEIS